MQREIFKYLYDIQESIESINEFLGDTRDFHHYRENKLLRRAVERELEIIGEATSKLLQIEPEIDISDGRRIVNLRNWIIHGYDRVDDVIIWGILSGDLPKLQQQVEVLLST